MPQSFFYVSVMFKQSIIVILFFLISCSDQTDNTTQEQKTSDVAEVIEKVEPKKVLQSIDFIKTTDGSSLIIPEAMFDTDAAKEFLATGKNIYVGDAEAIKMGKKRYNLWSCTQCHGPTAKGQVGPGLTGPDFRYPKDANNKGMFETIWAGTNGGMGAKGFGLMTADDGVTPDELLKIIAFIRSNGSITGNEE
jgi:cytochrome c-L